MSGVLPAFDFGAKSISVAAGQRIIGAAHPLPAIKAQDGTSDWNVIERLPKEWQSDEIIVGLPLNTDSIERPLIARACKSASRIHGRLGIEVKFHDERLNTMGARSGLSEQGGYRVPNKGKVDSASAVIILESYFEQGYQGDLLAHRFLIMHSLFHVGCGVSILSNLQRVRIQSYASPVGPASPRIGHIYNPYRTQ